MQPIDIFNVFLGNLILANKLQSGAVYTLPLTVTSGSSSISTTAIIQTAPCSGAATSTATTVSSNLAPTFSSSSYSATYAGCTVGTLIGTISAISLSTVTYSLSGASSTNFAINPTTGALYLNGKPTTSPASFSMTAKNSYGSTTVSVSVTTNCLAITASTTAATTVPIVYPNFPVSSYSFSSACAAGSIVGQVK